MKAPKSLTNRRDTLKSRIKPLQDELDKIESAIAVLEGADHAGETTNMIAAENKSAASAAVRHDDNPLAGTKAEDRSMPRPPVSKEAA